MRTKFFLLFAGTVFLMIHGFSQQTKESGKMNGMNMKSTTSLDTLAIEKIMGMKGKSNKGEYKVTVPQNDLSIEVDSFKIIPAMGLGTWVAFTPSGNGAMIMGDIVLTEADLKPV